MPRHIELGKLGEDIAVQYLKRRGYKIIKRNYRKKWGEIDIISKAPNGIFVFVEVKTVSGPDPQITGEYQMTTQKLSKFRRVVEIYINGEGAKAIRDRDWRMDLMVVVKDGNEAIVRHYQSI